MLERNIRRFKAVLFRGGIFYHLRSKNRNMDKIEGVRKGLEKMGRVKPEYDKRIHLHLHHEIPETNNAPSHPLGTGSLIVTLSLER